jgi:carboxypeptidase C (cathepsin A)
MSDARAEHAPFPDAAQDATSLLTRATTRSGMTLPGTRGTSYTVRAEFVPAAAGAAGRTSGAPDAAIGLLSYLVEAPASTRPVCFVFNGGPGASSAFLNVGALGPRRLVFPEAPGTAPLPIRLADNVDTLLHDCDLVFIDPPDTGFSRRIGTPSEVFTVDGDAQLLIDAIRVWLDRHGRWSSRVFLCGESYGAARAAVLADAALDHGIAFAGLMLISPALDMQPVLCIAGNDVAYALRMPAYAATAAWHRRLGAATPADASCAAQELVGWHASLTADGAGGASRAAALDEAATRLAASTGLSKAFLSDKALLVSPSDFATELLREQRHVIGKMDARVVAAAGLATPDDEDDAAIDAVYAPIATAMRIVLREELQIPWGASYEVFSHGAYGAWQWNRHGATGNQFSSTSADLARALRRNPAMRVWACSGRYDLVTPTTSVDWSLDRLDIPPDARRAIHHEVLESGHMPYTSNAAHRQMSASIRHWLSPKH